MPETLRPTDHVDAAYRPRMPTVHDSADDGISGAGGLGVQLERQLVEDGAIHAIELDPLTPAQRPEEYALDSCLTRIFIQAHRGFDSKLDAGFGQSRYSIVPCTLAYLRELARTMRAEDRAEITQAGHEVRHCLFRLYRQSMDPLTALIDGEVAACWGDYSPLISDVGNIWMFSTPAIEKMPLAFAKEARAELMRLLERRRVLRSGVGVHYMKSLRFWSMMGFEITGTFGNIHIIELTREIARP